MEARIEHGGTETRRNLVAAALTGAIIGAAIEVHTALGPGLLEGPYEECLCHELYLRHIPYRRQVEIPVQYKGVNLDGGYRLDLLVNGCRRIESN